MSLIVRSNIKQYAKNEGINNVSGDFADKLEEKAVMLIKEACQRAKSNQRNTVMSKDL